MGTLLPHSVPNDYHKSMFAKPCQKFIWIPPHVKIPFVCRIAICASKSDIVVVRDSFWNSRCGTKEHVYYLTRYKLTSCYYTQKWCGYGGMARSRVLDVRRVNKPIRRIRPFNYIIKNPCLEPSRLGRSSELPSPPVHSSLRILPILCIIAMLVHNWIMTIVLPSAYKVWPFPT